MSAARHMPVQKPGRSWQAVGTPRDLLDAVEKRFGPIAFDLAATAENSVAPPGRFYGPDSSLCTDTWTADWSSLLGLLWLNPEFKDCAKAAAKCCAEASRLQLHPDGRGGRVALLVPLSTSNWARDFVHGKARVLGLNPRVTFVGHKTAYPKDMMLALYSPSIVPTFECWRWK